MKRKEGSTAQVQSQIFKKFYRTAQFFPKKVPFLKKKPEIFRWGFFFQGHQTFFFESFWRAIKFERKGGKKGVIDAKNGKFEIASRKKRKKDLGFSLLHYDFPPLIQKMSVQDKIEKNIFP